jgi:hypothetical protein
MLVFDRKRQEEIKDGVWRDYEGGVASKIRPMNQEVARRIRKEAQKNGRFDQELHDRLFWDYLIADWNVQEAVKENGEVVGTKPMPCTAENKLLVVRAWQGYRLWVASSADSLGEEAAQVAEAALGNSGGSPAGRRTDHEEETSISPAPAAG